MTDADHCTKGTYAVKIYITRAFSLLLLALLVALAACGQRAAAPNEVSMVAADFSATSITIKVGQAVHFTDPAGPGGAHTISHRHNRTRRARANGTQTRPSPGFTHNSGAPATAV